MDGGDLVEDGVTAATVAYFLLSERPDPSGPQFLLRVGDAWYVRWPAGRVAWESTAALEAKGVHPPDEPLLTAEDNIDPRELEDLRKRLRATSPAGD